MALSECGAAQQVDEEGLALLRSEKGWDEMAAAARWHLDKQGAVERTLRELALFLRAD